MYFCWDLYDLILDNGSLNRFLYNFLYKNLVWSLYYPLNQNFHKFFHYPLYIYYFFDRNFNIDLYWSLKEFNDFLNLLLFYDDFRGDFYYLYSNSLLLALQYEFWWILDVPNRLLQISHHESLWFHRHSYKR